MYEESDEEATTDHFQAIGGESRGVYEAIFREIEDAVFLVDVERDADDYTYTFRRNNSSHRQQTGLSRDELRGQTPRELLGDEQGGAVVENYRRCVEQGETIEYEETLDLPGGTTHWQTKLTPITDDGQVTQLVGVSRDITEQKKHEQKLQRMVRRVETVLETMSAAVFLKDTGGRYLLMNQACRDLFGIGPEEDITGLTDADLFPPDRAEDAKADDQRVIETGDQIEIEETIPTTRGETVRLTRKSPVYDETGTVEAICGVSTDITAQKERERALERTRKRLQVLFDEAPDGVVVHDREGNVLDVNQHVVDELGYAPEALTSMSVADFEVGLDRETLHDIWEGMDIGETKQAEGEHERADGSTFPVEVWVSKIEVHGDPQYLALSRNISDRKQRKRELIRYESIVESMDDIVYVVGDDRQIEYVNPSLARYTGQPADALEGEDIEQSTQQMTASEADAREFLDAIEQALLAGSRDDASLDTDEEFPIRVEIELDLPEGTVVTDQWISPLHVDEEQTGAFVISRDITERRERERRIKELNERLELAIDGADLGVWDWNMQTDEVEFNDNWATMLGYAPEEIDSHLEEWERRVHPDDIEAVEEDLDAHMAGETDYYETEHRMRTADGDWRWIRDIGKIFERDADGNPVRAVGIHLDIDDQKRAEQALLEEREMFTQGPAVVFKWENAEGWPVEYVSENIEEVLGYTADELESGTVAFSEIIHEADRARVSEEVKEHSGPESDQFSHDPYRVLTADGDVRWVLDHTKNIRDGDGITHRLGYLVDITERKERERELQEFREAVEQSGHAVYITNTDGTIEYVNPAFEEITGYTEERVLGETPRVLSSDEHGDEFYEEFWETLHSGERWESEMVDERADGEQIVLHQTVSPLTGDDGEPERFVAVAQDITARKDNEEALEQAREELRQVIDLVPDLIFSKNREGEYLLANETTAEAYGLTPTELEGRREREVIPDVEDSEQFREDDIRVIESGEPVEIPEEELTTADGETKVLQTTKIPYQIPGTGEDAVLGYARDVTELKAYEQTLERQRDNLEVLNQIVRHDVRNNLQLVLAYSELLEDHIGTDSESMEHLRQVQEAGRDAVKITKTARDVTEVLLSSEAEHGPVNIRHVLEEQVEDVRASHERAIVSVDGPIQSETVLADDMLDSVFRNLLNNAIVHNDKKVPEVTVSATADSDVVRVRIADNGPGIPDNQKEQIFQEGEKGLDSEGTGLGLYLVETLVDRYGGDIWVVDNDPEGSVFLVELPRCE